MPCTNQTVLPKPYSSARRYTGSTFSKFIISGYSKVCGKRNFRPSVRISRSHPTKPPQQQYDALVDNHLFSIGQFSDHLSLSVRLNHVTNCQRQNHMSVWSAHLGRHNARNGHALDMSRTCARHAERTSVNARHRSGTIVGI
jgi:hypothetical protein